jgi:DMSO reductase family type II enzyme molybdopterin subunit
MLTRRTFLQGAGGALVLSLTRFAPPFGLEVQDAAASAIPDLGYAGFEDLYRQQWTWDRVVKGTHFVNCWYQRGCNWNVYVKDGIVFREEQAATYPQLRPEVPDFNPRGCQKGACYSARMYDAARLRYPLKRSGARGEGKWQRIPWEQALREIADRMIDVLTTDGPEAIAWDPGTAFTSGGTGLGLARTCYVLDTLLLDVNPEIGDHHPGTLVTCGKVGFASSADDVIYSDLILVWGGNPTYTQIPNNHFIHEARYHGASVVTIAPDYSASAIHADQWIPLNIGTDAAFGLALAHVIIEEGIYDTRFVKEQTDLPLLVRKDTARFLREADVEKGGDAETFYVFDQVSHAVQKTSKKTLALGSLDPALEGEFRVRTRDGEVTVTPVFALLRKHLARYTPEAASKITGTAPGVLRGLARQIARARAATCVTQSNFSKFYHGLEMERAQLLVFALAGQMGKKGAGFMSFTYVTIDGAAAMAVAPGSLPPGLGLKALQAKAMPEVLRMKEQGYTDEMIVFELSRREYAKGGYPSSLLFLYRHGGLEETLGGSKRWDPWMKRELGDYLTEALEKGWQFIPKARPRILFEAGGNLLRRIRCYPKLIEKLLPKLDVLVTTDSRMSNTALYSDYVLPVASWYEKDDITWATPIAPFAQVITRAVDPIAEAKPDWEFHCLLLKELQKRAAERGVNAFRDRAGAERPFNRVYDEFTFGERYTENKTEELLAETLSLTTNLNGVTWQDLKKKGFERYTGFGHDYLNVENTTDIQPNETITAVTWQTQGKQPWPTLTRRMQFYIDHDFYVELGEQLPVHKDPPPIGGNYPLQMTGGHTRWSIHTSWRDQKSMLRLNRGVPLVFIGLTDASARGIRDGDPVRVYNDISSFELQAKVSPALRPGQVIVYHAWEPFQFKDRRSQAAVTPSPINPIQLAGGYGHLQARPANCTPGSNDRATRVEVELVTQHRTKTEGAS